MRFSKLRLLGFKSFVDPTELIISDGLTGVVGPNGCGKSNLLEALRWVMGENRPTAMRGGGMEDVIFAGAASRPARNYAEVTLSLDNSEHLAPPAFNEAEHIDVVRRITRDAGSAYKVLGKDARARDVQMLFADASTGAHSPALVRQGQISELVNAKPKARRRVLEEAAGISGLYQRRHEAELKLNSTGLNLSRVEDVLEQLASQLATLARQAKQAARYREIAEDLRLAEGLLLFRRWSEADTQRLRAADALKQASIAAGQAQSAAAKATTARRAAEEKVPPLREEEAIAGAVLQRQLVEREALDAQEQRARDEATALEARINQLSDDKAREEALGRDAGETIERLEWEESALHKAAEGHDIRLADAQEAARQANAQLQDQEATLDQATEDLARAEAHVQALNRRADEARTLATRANDEAERAEAASLATKSALAEADARQARFKAEADAAQEAFQDAEAVLTEAEQARANAQAQEADTRAAMSERDGEVSALAAEVQAIKRLLAREADETEQVLDDVIVDDGFETALGAALADDLKSPEIAASGTAGWALLAPLGDAPDLPKGAEPLAAHVKAPAVLARRLAQIGLVEDADGSRLQADLKSGQRLVSRSGAMWRWDGLRANPEDTPSATALVLAQRNRLLRLQADLETAVAALDAAKEAYAKTSEVLQITSEAERTARVARKDAEGTATTALRDLGRAEADTSMLKGQLETQNLTAERRREDARSAAQTAQAADAELASQENLEDARTALESMKIAVSTARAAMLEQRGKADDMRREGETRTRRQQEIVKEVSGWKHRQSAVGGRLHELSERIEEATEKLSAAQAVPARIADEKSRLAASIETAETRRKAAADALALGETALREAEERERADERSASEAREARARAEAVAEAAQAQVAMAAERIEEDLNLTPETLVEKMEIDTEALPSAERVEMDVARLKRQRDALGAVNLRAEEDAREVEAEHSSLLKEKEDLDAAVAKLQSGIENLNKEGRQRLLDAFDEVNQNFSELFRHLFGGGEANLVLVESDDPLEAGLEIMCQPPGKKLSTLSLLSGGEQTLTAMSLIFAVFLANPSPICVLDEVDAPLDDANVTRFCDLLDEMTRKTDTRFLIITHHAVTMARMDRLFGVTMAEQGVSQLVSVDLREAEAIVA